VEAYSTKTIYGKKARIAVLDNTLNSEGIHPDVQKQVNETIAQLQAKGHSVQTVDFTYLDYLIPTYYVLTTAEASSNLARFDGVHYGFRSPNATDMESVYKRSRTEGFGREVKNRIMLGTFVLSSGYYDAYYSRAQKVRRLLRNEMDKIFNDYDFILLPTTPSVPFKIGAKTSNPVEMYLADIFTVLANLTGNPAISIPVGKDANGLPIGVQLMAKNFHEAALFAFSKEVLGE